MSGTAPQLFGGEVAQPLVNIVFGSGQTQQPVELTPKKNGKVIVIGQSVLVATNTYVSLETSDGTDYQVPTGKVYTLVRANMITKAIMGTQLGFGSTGVAEGTSAPADEVNFPWTQTGIDGATLLTVTTAEVYQEFNIAGEVPAAQFPFWKTGVAATDVGAIMIIGVEHDA